MVLRINVLWYNGFVFRQQSLFLCEKTGPLCLQQADKIRLDCEILKILCRLKYFDFYFVYSSAMLLIVLEMHFSLLFLNNAYFRMHFVVYKIRLRFFHVDPYY